MNSAISGSDITIFARSFLPTVYAYHLSRQVAADQDRHVAGPERIGDFAAPDPRAGTVSPAPCTMDRPDAVLPVPCRYRPRRHRTP
jgi:hypothetical protein